MAPCFGIHSSVRTSDQTLKQPVFLGQNAVSVSIPVSQARERQGRKRDYDSQIPTGPSHGLQADDSA